MIKKLNKIKPKKKEDPKVMCNKTEAVKIKYCDQDEILDNNTIMMHFLGKHRVIQIVIDASSS